DPYFAAQLAKSLTPDQMTQMIGQMGRGTWPRNKDFQGEYKRLVQGFGTAVSTATRNGGSLAPPSNYSDQWVHAIIDDDPGFARSAGAANIFRYGLYDTKF